MDVIQTSFFFFKVWRVWDWRALITSKQCILLSLFFLFLEKKKLVFAVHYSLFFRSNSFFFISNSNACRPCACACNECCYCCFYFPFLQMKKKKETHSMGYIDA
ncbi:hypothetical protein, unlikely [Trypanosoma brucei gambiense DAL972]|uniref:Uncharacterized protein n=1 Tax=Trypanosoma brucei gambiense (strain MHOM/CI/86/DAL972) TaxID=679716 RepID=D0A6F4_TRYB9|nr:hypothetical protein, unlikely [Trypanosoma brucei gambiense DAL972]CBH17255.1 hypothetical protein, unlikely [Trypanosoma brucei gambiense DAL972]|eukprot:XP_011779519.1 hypothetical protein, unlikely [Trypanosoma brucei gambiense DAL972]